MDFEALKDSWTEIEDTEGIRLSWNVLPSTRMVRLNCFALFMHYI